MKSTVPAVVASVALSLVLFVGVSPSVFAQALPAHSVNQAVEQLVGGKAGKLGFAANDPRISATEQAMSAEAEQLATSVASSPVSWALLAIQGGIGALLGAVPHALGDGSVDQWVINKDGTITLSNNPQAGGGPVTSPFPVLSSGTQSFWSSCSQVGNGCMYGASAEAVGEALAQVETSAASGPSGYTWTFKSCGGNPEYCTFALYINSNGNSGGTESLRVFQLGGSGAYPGPTCATGMSENGSCIAYAPPKVPNPGPAVITEPAAQAIAAVPSSDDGLPLDPSWLSGVADTLWQSAASAPGYQGLPYPTNDPITATDASTLQSSSPSTYPDVGDFVGPTAAPSGSPAGTSPYAIPTTDPGQASQPAPTNPGSGAEVNLGPDPGIGSPGLEATPTAQMILQPLLSMMPSLQSFAVPAHGATCPQPTFSLWGESYTVSEQCTLFEQYRAAIYGASVLAFSIAALFIVLTA
jgi:hypothetical protein